MEFFATCGAGFEQLLGDELRGLGCQGVRPLRGQVAWHGELTPALRACLWSRIASRVVVVVGRVGAHDAEELYEGVRGIAWEDHVPPHATFAVEARGVNAALRNSHFTALKAKDAIMDRLVARWHERPQVNVKNADLRLVARISRQHATLGIDLSGEPLFRRLPTADRGRRGLRPDIAAALLAIGNWGNAVGGDGFRLLSLFPGSGSVLAEAAGIALDRAPGIMRSRWGFTVWAGHSPEAWDQLLDEADARAEAGMRQAVHLAAYETRGDRAAEIERLLHGLGLRMGVSITDLEGLEMRGRDDLVVCDLSWARADDLPSWSAALGALARAARSGSPISVLTPDALPSQAIGAAPERVAQTIVGSHDMTMCGYALRPASRPQSTEGSAVPRAPLLIATSGQFAARLAKVARQRGRWARRAGVSCYRIYDADLPDYNVSIDLFQGIGETGRWLQVYEYAAPKEVDPALARARLIDALNIASEVLGVDSRDIFLRVRRRGRGGSQYADETHAPGEPERRGVRDNARIEPGGHLVAEGGLTFEVNFEMRLDCGLFLDHRQTRAWLRELASGLGAHGSFLNLFAYTGTGTCYAADGGCRTTTTVDLSRPSLEWARRNMARNGFVGVGHQYVQADVLSWAQAERHGHRRWDLVFCDVPTFSNSRRMGKRSFDVQRDHVELLIDISRLLAPGGLCLFSCNLHAFAPDTEALTRAGVALEDVTPRTIPEDFARTPNVHHCYLVRRA